MHTSDTQVAARQVQYVHMPPQEPQEPSQNVSIPHIIPPAQSPLSPPLLAAGLVAVLAVGALTYWFVLDGNGFTARAEPVRIGIVEFEQQTDAFIGFKEQMTKLGYAEGKDVVYERSRVVPGPTMFDDMKVAIHRMLDEKVDLLWLSLELQAKVGVAVTKERNDTTPIVFSSRFHDPIEYGLAASYRSSGNNATGVTSDLFEIIQKYFEFFKEIDPNIKKIGVFTDGFMVPPIGDRYLQELKTQAPRFGYEIVEYTTAVPPPEAEAEFNRVAQTIKKGDIDALFHIAGHHYERQERGESELAIKLGIPFAVPYEDIPHGGQFSYSDNFTASGAQSAFMVDKILKGTNPSDIPIEYGAKTELWLVMHRARAAGITFPESMRFKAARIFESDAEIPPLY